MTDLQEAFREAASREFSMVPDENELDYTFSPGFQRKMQRIIRAQVHGYWNMVNTVGKRIAIAAAIIVMLLTSAMAIKPVRDRVIKFFVEVYEEYFMVTFGEEESGDLDIFSEPITRYTFSWIPDNYQEIESLEFDAMIRTSWGNSTGGHFSLFQEIGTQKVTLDHLDQSLRELQHGNLRITYQTKDNVDTYIWNDDKYVFLLSVYDDISLDQILFMIDSLVEKN